MRSTAEDRLRVSKKCFKACERCRSMKVKCSGSAPCTRCARKKQRCHYVEEETRISVPESYLRDLERRCSGADIIQPYTLPAQRPSRNGGMTPQSVDHDTAMPLGTGDGYASARGEKRHDQEAAYSGHSGVESLQEDIGSIFRQNPLVDTDYTFAKSPDGRYWYMGPSSSWSFCRRVLALIGKHMPDCPPDPWNVDGGVYTMQWRPLGPDETPSISNLPPLDYALFLFHNVKFHFGPLYYLINEPEFLRNLHEFYEDMTTKASSSKLWYAQFLLILAFGKAFTGHVAAPGTPAGCQYATRAMGLLPGLGGLNNNSLLSIQVLTLAAVYFQAIDMRVAAFQHIGQAIRTAVLEGMHRHMPEDVLGTEHTHRCHITFWVVYMLEREFSAMIGAPSSIRDEDITARLPSETSGSLDSWNMTLHVRLSRLTADILTTVYGVPQAIDGSLIKNTQSILRNLADLSQDLKDLLDTHFQGSVSKASRMAIRLILSYHRCVVITTRPLVMCALHMHISQVGPNTSRKVCLSPAVASLMQSGVDSALNILRILRALGDEDLIEAFLPFQLEDAFSSAFILQLIRAVAPWLLPDETWGDDVDCVFDRMISKGNVVAPLRKVELSQLAQIMTPLTPSALHFQSPSPGHVVHAPGNEASVRLGTEAEPSWDLFIGNAMAGLDPEEILDLAAQLDVAQGLEDMDA